MVKNKGGNKKSVCRTDCFPVAPSIFSFPIRAVPFIGRILQKRIEAYQKIYDDTSLLALLLT